MRECPKNKQGSGNPANKAQFHQFLHQAGLHLEKLLPVLAEEQIAFMRSLVSKRKRIPKMLTLV